REMRKFLLLTLLLMTLARADSIMVEGKVFAGATEGSGSAVQVDMKQLAQDLGLTPQRIGPSYALTTGKEIPAGLQIPPGQVWVNGTIVYGAVDHDGRTMIPLKRTMEVLGGSFRVNPETGGVEASMAAAPPPAPAADPVAGPAPTTPKQRDPYAPVPRYFF